MAFNINDDLKTQYREELNKILSIPNLKDLVSADYRDLKEVNDIVLSEINNGFEADFKTVAIEERDIQVVDYGTENERNVLEVFVVTETPEGNYWAWSYGHSLDKDKEDIDPETWNDGFENILIEAMPS